MTREQIEANPILRWWPVIAFAVLWTLAGIAGFGRVQTDLAAVNIELQAHEKAQADTIEKMHEDILYIRGKLDKALEKRQ